jgi:hypothetical protein
MKKIALKYAMLCPICGKVLFTLRNLSSSRVYVGDGGQYRSRSGARGPRGVRLGGRKKIPYCWHMQDHPAVRRAAMRAALKSYKGQTPRREKRGQTKPR